MREGETEEVQGTIDVCGVCGAGVKAFSEVQTYFLCMYVLRARLGLNLSTNLLFSVRHR